MNYSNSKLLLVITLGILFLIPTGCNELQNVNLTDLKGYWEIDFISQKGETFKPSSSAPLIDYYALEEMSGFYKKVAPSIVGTFETSEDATRFKIEKTEDGIFIHFKTPWDEWKKKIIQLDSQKLILAHEKKMFHYIRPVLINVNP